MSDIIHLLPDSVANQIAAGEVIQRPASVLKELVENSIDAGAGFVSILIKDAGRTLIQVTDDGKGMSETDARMAFERHATSKIKDATDLFALKTMGFRGEALASIAAVAQVELKTKRTDDELGTLIEIAGTRVFRQESVMCSVGTTFQIKNLFFNVPARRRFLKSDNVEKSHILNEFYRIALVNPQVEFQFVDTDEEVYRLPATNIKQRIENIFGKNAKKRLQQQLLNIETETNLVKIYGFVGKPEFAQKSADQYFFVNGRYMRHPYFHKAVVLAYNQMIQQGDNPFYFIYFDVTPDTIDINIHPTKTEIKFENEQTIWSILNAVVKEALGKFNVLPSIDFDQDGAPEIPPRVNLENIRPPQTTFNPDYNPFNASKSYNRQSFDWEKLYTGFENKEIAPAESYNIPEEDGLFTEHESQAVVESETDQQQSLSGFSGSHASNFQFKNQYIVTGVKSGMMLIDQHRAHVRILFETYLDSISEHAMPSQQLLFPEILQLTADDILFFEPVLEDIRKVGFDIEKTEANSFEIKGVPIHFVNKDVVALCYELIEKSRNAVVNSGEEIHSIVAEILAESSALKSGQSLSGEEMTDLIDRLFACSNPNFTPGGKPVITIIEQEEILARFR